MLSSIVADKIFFQYFNYPVSMETLTIDVRSMFYIYSNEERIVVKVQRFLKDRIIKPYRAFLLNEGYEIPFANALVIKDNFLLSNHIVEEQSREDFVKKYQRLKFMYQEQLRILNEQRQLEEEERKKILLKNELLENERRKKILDQIPKQNSELNPQTNVVSSYNDLKMQLREKIGMTQFQQQELWSKYMPKIGFNNSSVVWDLFVKYDCKSFNELKSVLQTYVSTSNNKYI